MQLGSVGMHHSRGEADLGPRLNQIRQQLQQLLNAVDQFALEGEEPHARRPAMESEVQGLLKLRRRRDDYFGGLFADPAWDILLELFAAELSQERISVSSLCAGAAVPSTTALRWIAQLERSGLACRQQDPKDARRYYVSLTADGRQRMESYFRSFPNGISIV